MWNRFRDHNYSAVRGRDRYRRAARSSWLSSADLYHTGTASGLRNWALRQLRCLPVDPNGTAFVVCSWFCPNAGNASFLRVQGRLRGSGSIVGVHPRRTNFRVAS
uniref:(northern house mosquito) hypothetical protein n=1 Tax=Culex pipiens TaxID=7175 RepID=A0A8D8A4R2_CULPI